MPAGAALLEATTETMSIAPLIFTGVSEFSDDFQTILDRTVAIASLPLKSMQNEQANLLLKKQTLSGLRSVVASMGNAVAALGTIGETRALSASTTNANRVAVNMNGASNAGSYTISEITSVAKAASETSASGFETQDSTAVSADGTMELVLGGETHVIDLTGDNANTLTGLRDAINQLDAGVSATILNTGTGANPYYLSITALDSGSNTLELRETAGDGGSNILTADNQGADAIFKLNGLTITKSENTISDVIDGLTITIVSETSVDEEVEISLSSNRASLSSALSSLVSNYNGVKNQIASQIGETAGLLSGDFIIREIQNSLRKLGSYQGEGSISNLVDLGIEFDQSGVMSFDSTKFYALSENEFNSALDMMGSATTGFGALADNFEQISDPVTGFIRTQQDQYDITDERLSDHMVELAERIDYMQKTVSQKLQYTDVLLAQLSSQQSIVEASLEGLYLTMYGKKR